MVTPLLEADPVAPVYCDSAAARCDRTNRNSSALLHGAEWPNSSIFVLQVLAPEDGIKPRLRERGLARDAVKLADWDAFWARWGKNTGWTGVRVLDVLNLANGADFRAVLDRTHQGERARANTE